MRTIETTLYTFDELSDDAKARARDWYRGDDGGLFHDWHDCVFEDFTTIAAILGFSVDAKGIQFSGFWSQGDGASFRGRYAYAPGWKAKMAGHCPTEKEIFAIGDRLQAIQRKNFYGITADITTSGRYCHPGSMSIDCRVTRYSGHPYQYASDDTAEDILDCARDLAYWLYARLESEHDYLTSDESTDETIRANGYEFDEQGNRA